MADTDVLKLKGVEVRWLGHASFQIKYTLVIYTDPFKLEQENLEPADVILITHEHFDHCNPEDMKKIMKPDTRIFLPADCLSRLSRTIEGGQTQVLRPGDRVRITEKISVEAIPAYNTNKFRSPGIPFHPKDNEWMGYVIELDGVRIYQAGDTDFVPEMKELKHVNIALMPVSGTYVMTSEEAANAVNSFRPDYAVPMHYGTIVGSLADAENFKRLAKTKAIIMEKLGSK